MASRSCGFSRVTRGSLTVMVLSLCMLATPVMADSQVTLEFRDTDVVEVLKLLCNKAGLNLVVGKNVTGQVTLYLKEVPVEDALEVVLLAAELAAERKGDILSVMSQRDYELVYGHPYKSRSVLKSVTLRYAKVADISRALVQVKSNVGKVIADEPSNTLILVDNPEMVDRMLGLVRTMDQPTETRVFGFSYGTVKTFAPLLQDVMTKGVGRTSVDERTNKIAVTDFPYKLDEIEKIARAFDERSTEVLIEAKIIQVNLSDRYQFGIDWEALGRETITLKGLGALDLAKGGLLRVASPVSDGRDYRVVVEALRTYGDTNILSEPRLTVVNNQEAKILVGTKEPFVTKSVSQTGTGTAVTAESVTYLDIGIKLYVTPTITRDGFIQMKVRPEVSSKTGTLTTSENNEIPIVETAEAETVVLVQDGGTIILGGLIKDEKTVEQQRVPLLGDIPYLGIPFRSDKTTVRKTELVVFLTPRIVHGHRESKTPLPGPETPAITSIEEYEAVVADKIYSTSRSQSSLAKSSGTVLVEFTILPDGRLKGSPRGVSGERGIRRLAEQAVQISAPFPALPKTAGGTAGRTMKLAVTYE